MIDHVSIPVSDLERSATFYTAALATLGYVILDRKQGTVGFGKSYPEFWINERTDMKSTRISEGSHVCLRARSKASVDQFYQVALSSGGVDDGIPGIREKYAENYYAAFVRDPDGNRIEAVTF